MEEAREAHASRKESGGDSQKIPKQLGVYIPEV